MALFEGKQVYVGAAASVKEACEMYNAKAAEVGKPTIVFKSEVGRCTSRTRSTRGLTIKA